VASETLAATRFIEPAVIDPRRVELHRPGAERHLASWRVTIAHYQGMPLRVTLTAMALDVTSPKSSSPASLSSRFSTTFSTGGVSLPTRPLPGGCVAHAEGYAAFFMSASDPQLSVITQPASARGDASEEQFLVLLETQS